MSLCPLAQQLGFSFGHHSVCEDTLGETEKLADISLSPSRAIERQIQRLTVGVKRHCNPRAAA
jgi:hypothetical protein